MVIRLLDERERHQLQSSLVIRDVYDVIRELVQNGVDAGAENIEVTVELDRNGCVNVRCQDDGQGLTVDDLGVVGGHFWTSKYGDGSVYGFRGEAVAAIIDTCSIVAVSSSGFKVVYVNGTKRGMVSNSGSSETGGTLVVVQDALGCIPARKSGAVAEFGKSRRDLRRVLADCLALRPKVRLKVCVGEQVTECGGYNSLASDVQQLYGCKDEFRTVRLEDGSVKVCISSLEEGHQETLVYVNGKQIEDEEIEKGVRTAFPRDFVVLEVRVPVPAGPLLGRDDVWAPLRGKILALVSREARPSVTSSPSSPQKRAKSSQAGSEELVPGDLTRKSQYFTKISEFQVTRRQLKSLQVVGQVDSKLILARLGETLVALDQHAAAERVNLEEIYKTWGEDSTVMVDYELGLEGGEAPAGTGSEDNCLLRRWHIACVNGRIRSVPALLADMPEETLLSGVKRYLADIRYLHAPVGTMPMFIREACKSRACRRAVKFGDKLSLWECQRLVGRLSECADPFHCAHGRPTLYPLCELQ